MKNIVTTLLLLLALASSGIAQNLVSGIVTNFEGKPLDKVIVSVKNSKITDTTNTNGEYSIRIASEDKIIVFRKTGYLLQEIDANNKAVINITLTADIFDLTLEELMGLEVQTASKFSEKISETPATVVVLTQKEFESRGYTSLSEVLNDIPGFDVSASYGDLTQLSYARGNRTGSFNERTMLMIDGIEANILYAQNMNISSDFPISAIERIEIVYGPASAIYGPNVFSGIINIITKSASNLEKETSKVFINSGVGNNNTQYGEITYLANYEPVELMVAFRRYKSDMFDLVDRPGYFNKELFGNEALWGPYTK